MDIPSACERAMQLLQEDASRIGPKLNPSKIGEWSRSLSRIKLGTGDSKVWEEATRLLARLSLASEFPSDAETSALADEIESFLKGSFGRRESVAVQPRSELADVCAKAELLLSTARELIPQFEGGSNANGKSDYKKLSADVGRLVDEISASIDEATAEAKDEMRRLDGRGED